MFGLRQEHTDHEENYEGSSGDAYSFYRTWSYEKIYRGLRLGERAFAAFSSEVIFWNLNCNYVSFDRISYFSKCLDL